MTGEAAYPANLTALYTEVTGFLNDGDEGDNPDAPHGSDGSAEIEGYEFLQVQFLYCCK